MLGVVIAQLYRLQHSPKPDAVFGFYVLSKPISCIFHVSAICVALLGSVRFFRQQHAMAIGRIQAGGWEILIIGVYVLLVSEQRQGLDAMFGREADVSTSFCWLCSQSMLASPHIKAELWPYYTSSTMSNPPRRKLSGVRFARCVRCRSSFILLPSYVCGKIKHNSELKQHIRCFCERRDILYFIFAWFRRLRRLRR